MTSEQKPREFWVHYEEHRNADDGWFNKVDISSRNMWEAGEVLHLIEYSALEQAQAEINAQKEINQALVRRIDVLERQCLRLNTVSYSGREVHLEEENDKLKDMIHTLEKHINFLTESWQYQNEQISALDSVILKLTKQKDDGISREESEDETK
jgi:hypothetical protein